MAKPVIKHCKFTLVEEASMPVGKELTDLNFKILSVTPLTFEGKNVTAQKIKHLVSLLQSFEKLQEKASLDQPKTRHDVHGNTLDDGSVPETNDSESLSENSDESDESFIILDPMSEDKEKASNLPKHSENVNGQTAPNHHVNECQPRVHCQLSESAKAEASCSEYNMLQDKEKIPETCDQENCSENENNVVEEELSKSSSKLSVSKDQTNGRAPAKQSQNNTNSLGELHHQKPNDSQDFSENLRIPAMLSQNNTNSLGELHHQMANDSQQFSGNKNVGLPEKKSQDYTDSLGEQHHLMPKDLQLFSGNENVGPPEIKSQNFSQSLGGPHHHKPNDSQNFSENLRIPAMQIQNNTDSLGELQHQTQNNITGMPEDIRSVGGKIISLKSKSHAESASKRISDLQSTLKGASGASSNQNGARPKDFNKSLSVDPSCAISPNETKVYSEDKTVRIVVKKAVITKLQVDCIVSETNKYLYFGGGVSKVIASAAGERLRTECREHICHGNIVETTNIFVSTGGNLEVRHVFHAVGPGWKLYDDKRKNEKDLRQTILRCLAEAVSRKMTSIAFPSISSAIFRVPKDICAKNYVQAAKNFTFILPDVKKIFPTLYPENFEISFVDIDQEMVRKIQESFTSEWKSKPYESELEEDKQFVIEHILSKETKQTQGSKGSGQKESRMIRSSTPNEPLDYLMRNQLTVSIRTGHATDFEADCIILIGDLFKEVSGLSNFNTKKGVSVIKTSDDPSVKLCSLHKPGSSRSDKLMCLVKTDFENLKDEQLDTLLDTIKGGLVFAECFGQLDKDLECVVVTSYCLYSSKGGKNNQKTVGKLSEMLFNLTNNSTEQKDYTPLSVNKIIIAASDEWLPVVCKVFGSRLEKNPEVIKKVPRTASHMEPKKDHRQPQAMGGDDRFQTHQRMYPLSDPSYAEARGSDLQQKKECPICRENLVDHQFHCCDAGICKVCLSKMPPQCPFCKQVYGNQPKEGIMECYYSSSSLPGYEYWLGSFTITYRFGSGIQQEDHPNPGRWYSGIYHTAYLPFTEEGCQVLVLLRVAFFRRLTFTIATSNTTWLDDQIVWNNIHHKTKISGGSYGYPDPSYTQRVLAELADVGVTLDSMTPSEVRDVRFFLSTRIGPDWLWYFPYCSPRRTKTKLSDTE